MKIDFKKMGLALAIGIISLLSANVSSKLLSESYDINEKNEEEY